MAKHDDQQHSGGQEGREDEADDQQGRKADEQDGQQGSNPLETAATWVSGLLLLAASAWLVYEGVRPAIPPRLLVEIGPVDEGFVRYAVPLRVVNEGGEAARAATVGVELLRDGRRVAAREVTLPWVPAHSARLASVVFDVDPRAYNVRATVTGFVRP